MNEEGIGRAGTTGKLYNIPLKFAILGFDLRLVSTPFAAKVKSSCGVFQGYFLSSLSRASTMSVIRQRELRLRTRAKNLSRGLDKVPKQRVWLLRA
jgi:hypothetical protein